MAEYKFTGENKKFHLEDDKERKPLKKGEVYEITVKRAEAANEKYGTIFERVEK